MGCRCGLVDMEINHFLITRFNIAIPAFGKDKKERPTRTDEWYECRFGLFEKYCLPSVMSQTCRDFRWLCLFDRDTPEKYLARIEGYRRLCANLEPCFLSCEEAVDLPDTLERIVAERITRPGAPVLTTRLDNDDAIRHGMIECLQDHLKNGDFSDRILSFYYGYQYLTDLDMLLKINYKGNHFTSRVQPPGRFRTVMDFSDMKARFFLPVEKIGQGRKAYWLEIVHDTNVANSMMISSVSGMVLRKVSLSDFSQDVVVEPLRTVPYILTKYLPGKTKHYLGKPKRMLEKRKSRRAGLQ